MDVRLATSGDVDAICEFGAMHIPEHYGPLLGAEAAQAQVDDWWIRERFVPAADDGRIVVATDGDDIVAVGEWSLFEGNPVIWKLYVHPSYRGRGIGPRLIAAIVDHLPDDADRVQVEHFSVNERASAFYEREGFRELRTIAHSNPVMNVVWRERSLDSFE